MKKLLLLGLISILSISFIGCTAQSRAKKYGGTYKVELPAGQEFVDATWKGDELWYITKPRSAGDRPETFTFQEDSKFGLLEGKVVFIEK